VAFLTTFSLSRAMASAMTPLLDAKPCPSKASRQPVEISDLGPAASTSTVFPSVIFSDNFTAIDEKVSQQARPRNSFLRVQKKDSGLEITPKLILRFRDAQKESIATGFSFSARKTTFIEFHGARARTLDMCFPASSLNCSWDAVLSVVRRSYFAHSAAVRLSWELPARSQHFQPRCR